MCQGPSRQVAHAVSFYNPLLYAILGPQKIQEVQSYASQRPLLILGKLGLGLGAAPDTATQFSFQFVMSFVLLRALPSCMY
jgi:hypothetical protein